MTDNIHRWPTDKAIYDRARRMSLGVARIERKNELLKDLSGQMIATLVVNFGKGHLLDELQPLASEWNRRYEAIMAARPGDAECSAS